MNKLRGPIRSVKLITLLLAQVLLAGCQVNVMKANVPMCSRYFVDAHSQVEKFIDPDSGSENEMTVDKIRNFILQKMQSAKVAYSILYPRAGQNQGTIVDISNPPPETKLIYPASIYPGIAVKGDNYKSLQKRLGSEKFYGLGEVLLYHAEKSSISAPQVRRYPSDPWVQAIYREAKEKEWPFIVHIEDAKMAADDAETQKMMYEELCRVGLQFGGAEAHRIFDIDCPNLDQDELDMTDHPVVFIHMAQLPPDRVEWILDNNDKVHFMISHSNPITARRSQQPWINMFSNGELSPSWGRLLKKYPKRFIFALDNVTQEHWTEDYEEIVELWEKALKRLPDEVADAVAHGNAERLWGLPPTCYMAFPNIFTQQDFPYP